MPDPLETFEDRLAHFVDVHKERRPWEDRLGCSYEDAPLLRSDILVALETERAALAEVQRLQAELDRIRSLHPAATINPAVHTPARVLAHLHRIGWVREGGGRVAELWHPVGEPDKRVMVPLIPTAPDYAKVLRFLASDLARVQGVDECDVLAGIEAVDA